MSPIEDLTVKGLRAALKSWGDVRALGDRQLANWQIVEDLRLEAGYEDTPAGRGLAVRDLLEGTIEDLRPDPTDPRPEDPSWRNYLILKERYVDGRSAEYLAGRLSISRSTYNHAQLRAEEALLAKLMAWEEEHLAGKGGSHSVGLGSEMPRPFMAPQRRPKGLIGRDELLQKLRAQLTGEPASARLALYGLPGVGKTALAVELAHDPAVRGAYPDGLLWAGLGPSPELSVLLHLVAGSLGMPQEQFSALDRLDDRVRAVHAAVGDRRMLLVLDDVWTAEDALALQIGGPACGCLLTARSPALVQELTGFEPVEVSELGPDASLRLIEAYAPTAVKARRAVMLEAIHQIGGLPLTLVMVGGFLRRETYSGQPRRLAQAFEALRQVQSWGKLSSPVSALDQRPGMADGAPLSLFGVIAMSERALGEQAQLLLRDLAYFPSKPDSFPEALALAMAEASDADLDELLDAGLLESAGADRYQIHPSISQYAANAGHDPALGGRYVRAVLAWLRENASDPLSFEPDVGCIHRGLDLAELNGMAPEKIELAHLYFQYLRRVGLFRSGLEVLEGGLEAVEEGGTPEPGRLLLLLDAGLAHQRLGEYEAARDHYENASTWADTLGDMSSKCAALQGLGAVAFSEGDFEGARELYEKGLGTARLAGLAGREAGLLSNLGTLAASKGDAVAAGRHFEAGLKLARTTKEPELVLALLSNLGTVNAQRGDLDAAEAAFREGVGLAESHGDRATMVALLTNLGTLAYNQGMEDLAREQFAQALELAREVGDSARTCQLLANLGAIAIGAGEVDLAASYLMEGLSTAETIGHREHQVLLHINLAELHKQEGNTRAYEAELSIARALAEEIDHRRYLGVLDELAEA